jgi:hypothetical protein
MAANMKCSCVDPMTKIYLVTLELGTPLFVFLFLVGIRFFFDSVTHQLRSVFDRCNCAAVGPFHRLCATLAAANMATTSDQAAGGTLVMVKDSLIPLCTLNLSAHSHRSFL